MLEPVYFTKVKFVIVEDLSKQWCTTFMDYDMGTLFTVIELNLSLQKLTIQDFSQGFTPHTFGVTGDTPANSFDGNRKKLDFSYEMELSDKLMDLVRPFCKVANFKPYVWDKMDKNMIPRTLKSSWGDPQYFQGMTESQTSMIVLPLNVEPVDKLFCLLFDEIFPTDKHMNGWGYEHLGAFNDISLIHGGKRRKAKKGPRHYRDEKQRK